MDKTQLSEAQKAYQDEQLKRGAAFEELIRTKGWEYVKAFYQNKMQALANNLMLSADPITKFEGERQELVGIRKLLAFIDSDIKALEEFRKKDDNRNTE